MNHARLLRPLAAVVSALAIGTGAAVAAAPAEAASPALYTAPPVPGTSPPGCTVVSGSTKCFLDAGNWAGYLAVGSWSGASFINMQVSFSVPSVNCAKTATGYAGQGAGLGGFGAGAGNGMTDYSNQSGGFISSAWPTFYQVTQQNVSSGATLATSGSLYGGQAFTDTWQQAS